MTATLILSTLQDATLDRHHKALAGLKDKTLTVTLTHQSDRDIRALVKNADGKEYGVSLTEQGAYCSCPDALYRSVTCKHAVAVALSQIHPQEKKTAEPLHL